MCFSDEPGQDAGRGKEAADLRVASVASRVWSAEGGLRGGSLARAFCSGCSGQVLGESFSAWNASFGEHSSKSTPWGTLPSRSACLSAATSASLGPSEDEKSPPSPRNARRCRPPGSWNAMQASVRGMTKMQKPIFSDSGRPNADEAPVTGSRRNCRSLGSFEWRQSRGPDPCSLYSL